MSGCEVGRSVVVDGGTARAVELLLPAPLKYGQGWTLQFRTSDHATVGPSSPAGEPVEHSVRPARPVGLLVAQAVFADDARPTRVRRVRSWIDPATDRPELDTAWSPLRGRSVSCVVADGNGAFCALQWPAEFKT